MSQDRRVTPWYAPAEPRRVPATEWTQRIGIACVLGATVLVVLDAAIVNVALPEISRSLHVAPAASLGVITGYQLAVAMALLPFASIGESGGPRRVYTGGVFVFVSASVLCAHASSLSMLVASRFLQGLGGAAILSLGAALLRVIVPERHLGAAIGWYAMAVALASAAGPTIGALMLSFAGWSSIFAINLPLGLFVLLATRAIPDVKGHGGALDLASMGFNATAFGALVICAELLPERPATAAALGVLGVVAILALIRRAIPQQRPMIPLDLLRDDTFRLAALASVCCFIGQSAAMVSLPFHLQHAFGQDVLRAGLLLAPWPLTVAFVAPVAGRLADRFRASTLSACGAGLLALGLAGAALVPRASEPFALIPFLVVSGAGFGLFQVPNNRILLLSAPKERSGAAGGMQATARLTGQTIGALLVTLLFTMSSIDHGPRVGIGLACALTALSGLVTVYRGRAERRTSTRDS